MPFFYCCSELRCCQGMLQWVLILCAVHVPWSVRRQNKLLVYEYLDLSSQVTKLSPLQRPSIKCCLGEKVIVTKQINTSFCGKNAKLVNVKARIDRGFKHLIAVVRVCMRACVRACSPQSTVYCILTPAKKCCHPYITLYYSSENRNVERSKIKRSSFT